MPENYTRLFDYSAYQNANPTKPLPGVRVNIDLDEISTAIGQTNAAVRTVVDPSGGLLAGTVGLTQLTAGALADIAINGGSALVTAVTASAAAALASQTAAAGSATTAGTSATAAGVSQTAAAASAVAAAASAALASAPVPASARVTLTTGVPVTGSDVTGAATVFLTGAGIGRYVPAYDGTVWHAVDISTDLSCALDSNSGHTGYQQSGKNFDVWVAYVAGVPYFGTGPAWTSDNVVGTGAGTPERVALNGVLTNKNAMTLRFGSASGNTVSVPVSQATLLGTIRTTADGVTEDSFLKRFVSNLYNVDFREFRVVDTTDNWTYSTAAFRQKNGSAANQVEWVHCATGRSVVLDEDGFVTNLGASTHDMGVGIGIDSTTTNSAQRAFKVTANNTSLGPQRTSAVYNGYPGIGYHKACELEYGGGSDTQLWFGDAGAGVSGSGVNGPVQTGMAGRTPN